MRDKLARVAKRSAAATNLPCKDDLAVTSTVGDKPTYRYPPRLHTAIRAPVALTCHRTVCKCGERARIEIARPGQVDYGLTTDDGI